MEAEREFQHESTEDKDSVVKYLQMLSEGFRTGQIEFKSGQEKIVLRPSGLIQIDLDVKTQNKKEKLTIKLSWKDGSLQKKEKNLTIRPTHG